MPLLVHGPSHWEYMRQSSSKGVARELVRQLYHCRVLNLMPRLQAVVRVIRPCKPCILDFIVCLGVCRKIWTIVEVAEAQKYVYRLLGEIPATNWL